MSSPVDKSAHLAEGAKRCLDPLLVPAGFTFRVEHEGPSSGGPYASGAYTKGPWRLELHFRNYLGHIRFGHGDASVSLGEYLRAVGGWDAALFPRADGSSLQAFAALADDIGKYCGDFLLERPEGFARIVARARQLEAEPRRLP